MLLGKTRKIGRHIRDIEIGEKLTLTEKIEDKDLLLYLGLTNDNNPLYIQHDFAAKTQYEKPIVPSIMLTGIITSAISKYLPGPGSHITKQYISFPTPTYHYSILEFTFEIKEIIEQSNNIVISVIARNDQNEIIVDGEFHVTPPILEKQ
ncbi:enoyl-CoA hydratase [Psychrobacillus psychrodurans]|uniref:MaoC/PaaZ C-terminal domain-containing protein n=1 Tax=Psychrobacillus TaxID=1221880 RepID=UPI0008F436B8|nr:MaoC/PaaZ C-terminal domain-containing protein [Psychrobacillus psychrodurans]MCK1996668.1 enoyl-CoA hydratase [Psychrobacillus psychrodurans]MCZ8541771.1 enoyl-CoA hydratase [Psychrobacillus psychrodurans]SFN01158.1 Acyl dehydratase [Psychrobacillus psychrodurans]